MTCRQKMFFKANPNGGMQFVGTYTGGTSTSHNFFGGLATDEVYLTRAECYARAGNIDCCNERPECIDDKAIPDRLFVPFTACQYKRSAGIDTGGKKKGNDLPWAAMARSAQVEQ